MSIRLGMAWLVVAGWLVGARAPANLIVSLDPGDGSWTASVFNDTLEVSYEVFFSQHLAFWLDGSLSGTALSSLAPMTYSGVFGGNAVSGAGVIGFSAINEQLSGMQIQITSGLPASSGSFSSLTITSAGNFSNPSNYGTVDPGAVDASSPSGNAQGVLQIVPEPASALLMGLGAVVAGCWRRRRRC